jgi:two-component system response regulator AlgR
MHILIVDDEALARNRLRTLLTDCENQPPHERHQLSEAAHAGEAMVLLTKPQTHPVEAVLLDIHMPGQDGLSLAHAIQALPAPPAVVFVTAHADHAVQAFELDALDYLTKPVRLARLQQALAKIQRTQRQPPTQAPPAGDTPSAADDALVIQDRGRMLRIPLHEVLYLKAEQKYLTVRTPLRSYLMDGSLNELETRHPQWFLRVHRNALVARRAMRVLEKHDDPVEGEGWALRLQGVGELLAVSRRQVAAVREALAR